MAMCEGCAGSGKFVATQNMIAFANIPDTVLAALRDASPMPAIVDCPACDGSGSVRECRICGCTDDRACPGGCSWVERDLCSACAP